MLRVEIAVMMFLNGTVMMMVLHHLSQLFALYAKGEIFTLSIVTRLRTVGYALLGFPAIALLNSCVGALLVAQAVPGKFWLDLHVNFSMLFAALVVIVISWIMDVGRLLREENELTV